MGALMRSFGFEVKSREGKDVKIPLAVAGQTMVDVQRILTEIVSSVLRTEMLIQNDIPSRILSRYQLTVGGNVPGGISSESSSEGRQLIESCLDAFCGTLDYVGKGIVNPWISNNYPETLGRRKLCEAILALSDHIDGYTLRYGDADSMREFTGVNRDKMLAQIKEDSAVHRNASRLGVLIGDIGKKKVYLFDGKDKIQVHFGNAASEHAKNFISNGIVIVRGTGEFNENGVLKSIKDVTGITPVDTISYKRIVSENRDITLACALPAHVTVNADGSVWTFRNDDLGVDVSKNNWDDATLAFHEYLEFLWEEYAESDRELEGEEKDIADLLRSYAPLF